MNQNIGGRQDHVNIGEVKCIAKYSKARLEHDYLSILIFNRLPCSPNISVSK